jgi:hypothetical protein
MTHMAVNTRTTSTAVRVLWVCEIGTPRMVLEEGRWSRMATLSEDPRLNEPLRKTATFPPRSDVQQLCRATRH